jgi:hypothetical protein
VGRIYMDRGRVGEERGGKEMDGCLLTQMGILNVRPQELLPDVLYYYQIFANQESYFRYRAESSLHQRISTSGVGSLIDFR